MDHQASPAHHKEFPENKLKHSNSFLTEHTHVYGDEQLGLHHFIPYMEFLLSDFHLEAPFQVWPVINRDKDHKKYMRD